MTAFFIVVPVVQLQSAKHTAAGSKHVTLRYILPMFAMALGIAFVDIYFSKTYRVEKDGSVLKYFQRLVVYPLLMDMFLGICFSCMFSSTLSGKKKSGKMKIFFGG